MDAFGMDMKLDVGIPMFLKHEKNIGNLR